MATCRPVPVPDWPETQSMARLDFLSEADECGTASEAKRVIICLLKPCAAGSRQAQDDVVVITMLCVGPGAMLPMNSGSTEPEGGVEAMRSGGKD